jgi:hypothetical protein
MNDFVHMRAFGFCFSFASLFALKVLYLYFIVCYTFVKLLWNTEYIMN